MKRCLLLLTILFGTVALFGQAEKSKTFPLESMITVINNSLDKANEQLNSE